MQALCAAIGLLLGAAASVAAQTGQDQAPRVENARMDHRTIAGPLPGEFSTLVGQASSPEWIGYAVPQVDGEHQQCCGDYHGNHSGADGVCGTCRLEDRGKNATYATEISGKVRLEQSGLIAVLFRVEQKHVGRIRAVSHECALDVGGLPFVWLNGVKPGESVALLKSFVSSESLDSEGDRSVSQAALFAIAIHGDPAADRALESFVVPSQPDKLRREAAFWLGAARGKAGVAVLQRMAAGDPSPDVRAQVAFALSLSHEQVALDEMIRMAKNDQSAHVRSQALFWLAQKAGNKAVGTITSAVNDDPDTEVKKRAVFALSQLPKDDGVPRLIEVARSNRNPAVRKQAMFWLGQSNDPRALAFFEQVLTH
jgi:HEAT repeat protein